MPGQARRLHQLYPKRLQHILYRAGRRWYPGRAGPPVHRRPSRRRLFGNQDQCLGQGLFGKPEPGRNQGLVKGGDVHAHRNQGHHLAAFGAHCLGAEGGHKTPGVGQDVLFQLGKVGGQGGLVHHAHRLAGHRPLQGVLHRGLTGLGVLFIARGQADHLQVAHRGLRGISRTGEKQKSANGREDHGGIAVHLGHGVIPLYLFHRSLANCTSPGKSSAWCQARPFMPLNQVI